jgi:hypothetical protein
MIDEQDVGKLFKEDDSDDPWIMETYCPNPTVTFRNLKTDERRGGAVGSPILRQFVRAQLIEIYKRKSEG